MTVTYRTQAAAPAHDTAGRNAMRSIAAFEALKGVIALAASIGLLSLLHHDLHQIAADLISHFGLDPDGRYPSVLLHYVDVLTDTNRRSLVLAAGAYITVRLLEAWGLWHELPWGEWLGAISGAIYVPFELRHLLHKPSVSNVTVLAVNIGVVCFLAWRLWQRRQANRR